MLFRGYRSGDEHAHALIRRATSSLYPGLPAATSDTLLDDISPSHFPSIVPIYADESAGSSGGIRGTISLRADGRVSIPECLPGHEHLAPELVRQAMKLAASRGLSRAVAIVPARWPLDEVFRQSGFCRVREIVNFTQSALGLPTAVGRSSTRFQSMTPADLPGIEFLSLSGTDLTRDQLGECLSQVSAHSAQPPAVMRRPDGTAMGVGWLMENDDWPPVEVADPLGCDLHVGTWGAPVHATARIDGVFSFLAASPLETLSVGLDLLGHLMSEMTSHRIDTVATQVPADASQLVSFYDRYFLRQGTLSIYACRLPS